MLGSATAETTWVTFVSCKGPQYIPWFHNFLVTIILF